VILWHCTTVGREEIEVGGLRPGPDSWRDWIDMLGPATPRENAVWLTAVPDFVGRPSRWAYKCIIPSTDRKLVKFEKLLRKAGLDVKLLRRAGTRVTGNGECRHSHWYLYFDAVYPVEVARVNLVFEDGIGEDDRRRFVEAYGGAA
jgi:hypothetical protein